MPRTTIGEEGTRVVLSGLPYTQVPDAALRLSGTAFKILGRLQRLAGSGSSCEATNDELAHWCRRCTGTVQRAMVELEGAGLVSRRRRSGRRRIVLLYTLAGREASQARALNALSADRQLSDTTPATSALSAGAACNQRQGSMQSAPAPIPFEFEREGKEQQEPRGPAAVVVAPLAQEGGEEPPSRPAFLATLITDLGAALAREKRPAAGISPKTPRRPVVRDSVPDARKCTGNPSNSQEQNPSMKHKAQT